MRAVVHQAWQCPSFTLPTTRPFFKTGDAGDLTWELCMQKRCSTTESYPLPRCQWTQDMATLRLHLSGKWKPNIKTIQPNIQKPTGEVKKFKVTANCTCSTFRKHFFFFSSVPQFKFGNKTTIFKPPKAGNMVLKSMLENSLVLSQELYCILSKAYNHELNESFQLISQHHLDC